MLMKSVFEMNAQELKKHLMPFVEKLVNDRLAAGGCATYLNSDKSIPAQYVDEYADGRMVYTNIDTITGKEILVYQNFCCLDDKP